MVTATIVFRGFLNSLSEHRGTIAGWPWASIQHTMIQNPQRLSAMAGATFATIGDFTEPRQPPRFAIELDTSNQALKSFMMTGEARDLVVTRPGLCPGFQSLQPSGTQEVPSQQHLATIREVLNDTTPNGRISGANTLMQIGTVLLPLLARDYPDLGLTAPTIVDRLIQRRQPPP
jgi:hypothetical protein